MKDLTLYALICVIIVIVGGINWGLVGLFNINLISALFGTGLIARLLYIIVGVAAGYLAYLLYLIYFAKKPPMNV